MAHSFTLCHLHFLFKNCSLFLCKSYFYTLISFSIFHSYILLIFIFWGISVLPNNLNLIKILSSEAINFFKFFVSVRTLTVLVLVEINSFASSAVLAFLSTTNSSSSTTILPTRLLTASLPLILFREQYQSGRSASFSIKDVLPTPC